MNVGKDCRAPGNWVLAVALSAAMLGASPADAVHRRGKKDRPDTCYRFCAPRQQDEIWLVNSRRLGCPERGNLASPSLRVKRRSPDGKWLPATPEEFFAADPGITTSIYVHGNRVNCELAVERGMRIYHGITRCDCDSRPLRYVIWSWPSDALKSRRRRIKTYVDDVNVKAHRACVDGYYLAWWLSQMHPDSDVKMIGYSYGPRVILAALDLLGGGIVHGRVLPKGPYAETLRADVFSFVAALPCGALSPGGLNENAVLVTDTLINLYNPIDPAMQFYPRFVRSDRGEALGRTGVPKNACLNYRNVNTSCIIGKRHQFKEYAGSCYVMGLLREMVFDDCESHATALLDHEPIEAAVLANVNSYEQSGESN
jgi:hypothetical protein